MNGDDIPEEWRERIAETCFWLIDNYAIWQPFGLLVSVGVLLFSISVMVNFWENSW